MPKDWRKQPAPTLAMTVTVKIFQTMRTSAAQARWATLGVAVYCLGPPWVSATAADFIVVDGATIEYKGQLYRRAGPGPPPEEPQYLSPADGAPFWCPPENPQSSQLKERIF